MSRRLAVGLAVLALALGLGATALLALRFSAERQAGKPGTHRGDGAARPAAVMVVELRLEGAWVTGGQPFGAASWLGAPGGDWRDLSDAAGCTAWNVAVWLDPERLVLHLAGRTVVYDLAREERALWAPLPDDRGRVAIALSPDGRVVGCREGPRVFVAEPTDLVLRATGGEELRRFPALGHTSPGEIIHHQTMSMAWLGDGSGVVYVDLDPGRSVTSVAYLDLTSGRVSEIVAVPSLEGRSPVAVRRRSPVAVRRRSPVAGRPPPRGGRWWRDIYLLADLVSEPASEPLVRVKAGQAFAWGSLVAEEAGRTVYALYLWPGP